jgi:hypothetical protein
MCSTTPQTQEKKMKLYLISQSKNNDYDTYSDAVVAAPSPTAAQKIHPQGYQPNPNDFNSNTWADPKDVSVQYLGEAKKGTKKGVICASFHAG